MALAIVEGRFGSRDQAMAFAMQAVKDAHSVRGEVARISSIRDGEHMDASGHYADWAFDFKLAHIAEAKRQPIVDDIREALQADKEKFPYADFDVVYGDEGHKFHGHVEWQPKRAMNR
jgi:hypothetical protein